MWGNLRQIVQKLMNFLALIQNYMVYIKKQVFLKPKFEESEIFLDKNNFNNKKLNKIITS